MCHGGGFERALVPERSHTHMCAARGLRASAAFRVCPVQRSRRERFASFARGFASIATMGSVEKRDAATFIRNGLLTVSTKCQDHHSEWLSLSLLMRRPMKMATSHGWTFMMVISWRSVLDFSPCFESLVGSHPCQHGLY